MIADVRVGLSLEDDAFSFINPGIEFVHDEVLIKVIKKFFSSVFLIVSVIIHTTLVVTYALRQSPLLLWNLRDC